MPMDAMVTAVIETSLNQLLALDKQSPERLRKLTGKVLKLELRELKPLWFVFSERRLDVLARFEGEADAVLSLSLTALGLLKEPSALTRYIREEKLDLSGDPQLVQAFSALLGELDIDWEEELSRYTGDVLAHTLLRGASQARRLLGRELCRSQRQLAARLGVDIGYQSRPNFATYQRVREMVSAFRASSAVAHGQNYITTQAVMYCAL